MNWYIMTYEQRAQLELAVIDARRNLHDLQRAYHCAGDVVARMAIQVRLDQAVTAERHAARTLWQAKYRPPVEIDYVDPDTCQPEG